MGSIKQPLSNVQLEILKAFSYNLKEEDLVEFRKVIALFFAKRSSDLADKIWDEKGWTDDDVDRLLKTKMRTPYKKS